MTGVRTCFEAAVQRFHHYATLYILNNNTWNHRIILIRRQYLKLFNYVEIELWVLDRNTWNHLTVI